jgi:hypothetical protein
MQNLCFGPKQTVSGCRSCEASILLHLTQNDAWECFGAFRKPSTGKNMQNLCLGTECTVSGYQVVRHPLYSIGPKMMFGCVSKHFVRLQYVKDVELASKPE